LAQLVDSELIFRCGISGGGSPTLRSKRAMKDNMQPINRFCKPPVHAAKWTVVLTHVFASPVAASLIDQPSRVAWLERPEP
jgi:hypothetical protein